MARTIGPEDRTKLRREALVRLLLADAEKARASAATLEGDEAWRAVFLLAEMWSVTSQLAGRISAVGIEPPAGPWQDFRKAVISTYARTASRASRGLKAMEHLEQSGERVAAFKGLASMARLYPRAAERSIKDVDLLVLEQDLPRAIEALREAKFSPAQGQDPEQVQALVGYLPNFSGNKAMVFAEAGGLEIDLHWSVGLEAVSPKQMMERTERLALFGTEMRVVGAADALALTVRHSVRENFAIDSICRDLFDVRGTLALWSRLGCLEAELKRACEGGGLLPLLTLMRVLHTLDEAQADAGEAFRLLSVSAEARERAEAEGLAALFFEQAREGRMEKDLLYLAHARPLQQMVAGATRSWREYRGLMQAMEEKLDGESQPMSARVWKLVQAARRLGPARVRSLRTLARLRFSVSEPAANKDR